MSSPTFFEPIVCVVDFHHARGPEVETWIGVEDGRDPASENEWPLLPFMALSDGAHSSTEDYSYFTLRHEATESKPATSLFGISCTRQMDAAELINRPAEVTRSTVQKAVVVICDTPQYFTSLREKLGFVTRAWFSQKDFTDLGILRDFQHSLAGSIKDQEEERDQFFGLSLREIIHQFKWQTLVLFKCLLLQPKMLFFGSHCERICMLQFSLISLIPSLIRNLQDCADPTFNTYEETFTPPTSLRTSDRGSLLSYVGLPLQIFGKGSLFGPYTPLQQLDMLTDNDTKSYVVGSTNSLLLAQKERYADILINLDENTITFPSLTLKAALNLTVPDRRWIDFLTQTVNDTWDEENPSRPKTLGYAGSEEFIRLQFEEYLLSLLSAAKYKSFLEKSGNRNLPVGAESEMPDPVADFGPDWFRAWQNTHNYAIFNRFTDSHVFDIVEPNHPCTGGLTIEDVQRRLAAQVAELHLDERVKEGREVMQRNWERGKKSVGTALGNLWADIEVMREAQRRNAAERKAATASGSGDVGAGVGGNGESPKLNGARFGQGNWKLPANISNIKAPDMSQAQATVQDVGKKAGAYLSSWGAWAAEKRKAGWGRSVSGSSEKSMGEKSSMPPSPTQSRAQSWVTVDRTSGSREVRDEELEMSPVERKGEVVWEREGRDEKGKGGEEAKQKNEEVSKGLSKDGGTNETKDMSALGITIGENKEEEAKDLSNEENGKEGEPANGSKEGEMHTVEL